MVKVNVNVIKVLYNYNTGCWQVLMIIIIGLGVIITPLPFWHLVCAFEENSKCVQLLYLSEGLWKLFNIAVISFLDLDWWIPSNNKTFKFII